MKTNFEKLEEIRYMKIISEKDPKIASDILLQKVHFVYENWMAYSDNPYSMFNRTVEFISELRTFAGVTINLKIDHKKLNGMYTWIYYICPYTGDTLKLIKCPTFNGTRRCYSFMIKSKRIFLMD